MVNNKEDLTKIAVYWNDEYIGEVDRFTFTRATKNTMAFITIMGEKKEQVQEDKE